MNTERFICQANLLIDDLIKFTEENLIHCDRQIKIIDHLNRIRWRVDLTEDEEVEAVSKPLKDIPMADLELSVRTTNTLTDHGFHTFGELYALYKSGLKDKGWVTKRMVAEIEDVLGYYKVDL